MQPKSRIPVSTMRAAVAVVTLVFASVANGTFAQAPLARLFPEPATTGSDFGEVVGISGDNVFALRTDDPADAPRRSVIKIFERSDPSWRPIQTLVAPNSEFVLGFNKFFVAGDFLVADGGAVALYRRDAGRWNLVDSPVHPTERYVAVNYLDEEYMVLTRRSYEPANVNVLFGRTGDTWEELGVPPEYAYRMCMAGDDAVQSIRIELQTVDPVTRIKFRNVDALLVSQKRSGRWSVTDTLYAPVGVVDHLTCHGNAVAYTGELEADPYDPNARSYDQFVTIASRATDGKWTTEDELNITGHGSGPMALELYEDHLYLGREYRVPEPIVSTGYQVLSEIRMYARRPGGWEFVRSITHPDGSNPAFDANDGCIGFDIAAQGDLLVTSAPIRNRGSRRRVGEVLIYSLSTLDVSVLPTYEMPTIDFEISHAYPNPGRGWTRVEFTLASAARVHADVFDVAGRRVVSLDEPRAAGSHELDFDTNAWAPGVYFLRLAADQGAPAVARLVVTQ